MHTRLATTPTEPQKALPLWMLVVLAVLGDLGWRAALLLPWALLLGVGAAAWSNPWMWGFYAALLVLLAWTLSPRQPLEGLALTSTQAPGLFAELDRLQSRLHAPCVHRVLLDDSFNAGAFEAGPPWRRRRTLLVGLPLLAVLTPEQTSAVLAHELGHFSRRHGVWGQWIYRARRGWLMLSGQVESDATVLERWVAAFANVYAPWFARLSWAHSRRCEFEADAQAAEAARGIELVTALLNLDVMCARQATMLSSEVRAWMLASGVPPPDWWIKVQQHLLADELQAHELARACSRRPEPDDSHPPLPVRAAALGVTEVAALAQRASAPQCAGQNWWSDWGAEMRLASERQGHLQALHWVAGHRLLQAFQGRVLAAHQGNALSWQHARYLASLGRPDQCLEMLERLQPLATEPDTSLALAWAEAVLTAYPPQHDKAPLALALLDTTVRRDPAAAWAARSLGLEQAHRDQDTEAIHRLTALLDRAAQRRNQAAQQVWQVVGGGHCGPSAMSTEDQTLLAVVLSDMQPVHSAWWGSAQGQSRDGRRYKAQVLVVQVDPSAMLSEPGDEAGVLEPLHWVLQQLAPDLTDLLLVRLIYTAEIRLAQILEGGSATAWHRAAQPHMSSAKAPVCEGAASKP